MFILLFQVNLVVLVNEIGFVVSELEPSIDYKLNFAICKLGREFVGIFLPIFKNLFYLSMAAAFKRGGAYARCHVIDPRYKN